MRIGITSPVVTAVPGAHFPWERGAGIEELGAVAEAADRLGFHHLTCSEHVAVPVEVAEQRGGTYWDPLATFGYLAARTRRIRLATQVLVLGYHHPLALAKRYGTLDRVSGGRLVLGFGVGSLEEEFRLLGAAFEGRGGIADDALAALRASLSRREPAYHGEHFDYEGFVVEPHAVQESVPLWIGGRTPRSLRRAVTYGDGWVPFGLPLGRLREMVCAAPLPAGFEVVLSAGRPLDPSGDADAAARALRGVSEAGATLVSVALAAESASHYVEQLAALAEIAQLPDVAADEGAAA
ncbi:TIGR03619 family F420-dependent LLM class oxidoreductase [Streptomyces diastaticus]|uniref:TIGR03619 family F420-dependent LLM class oxidoreductase n=1 Tax=Streptomyces rutgersensis TaxID=53451 RepID=A0ABX6RGA8_9ACTN|nr:TIGR03619 family F420-dependent LLM class oxidoreductase [Streptomyces rutgersensis]QNE79780.1 TIGR03619 family F420-dependent LLM class oxidoreductase [Streptomyces rutgersensis]